jgi:methionyl-tRNA formyltransferase
MQTARYVFVGDRFPVLNRMLAHKLNVVGVFCAKDFFHSERISDPSLTLQEIQSKDWLLDALGKISFDVLVSNGCPYILPVSKIKTPAQSFINIHASLLPDFPGPHPVNAAMLAGKDGGATCHHMQDEADTGAIISQVRIPNTPDVDLGLLYMLTILAEVEAFDLAFQRNFIADAHYKNTPNMASYFKSSPEKMRIDFSQSGEGILRQVRAFGIYSQGAWFMHRGSEFSVFDAELCTNPYLIAKASPCSENEVVFVYDGTAVIRKGDAFLKLKNIQTHGGTLSAGDILV